MKRTKKRSIFKVVKEEKTLQEYMDDVLIEARRIVEIGPGKQRYSSAQFEFALICFGDIKRLKQEMNEAISVKNLENIEQNIDWMAGFDWLDLSVSHRDRDAIEYFQTRLKEEDFIANYKEYIVLRSDNYLKQHEPTLQFSSVA